MMPVSSWYHFMPRVRSRTVISFIFSSYVVSVGLAALLFGVLQHLLSASAAETWRNYLVPSFIFGACIELLLLYALIDERRAFFDSIAARLNGVPEIRLFPDNQQFHSYLADRLPTVTSMRVSHLSYGSYSSRDPEYRKVLEDFLKRGGHFARVFVGNANPEFWAWCEAHLQNQNYSFQLYCLDRVVVDRMKLMDVMLLDNEEVCLGGGYSSGLATPVISIRHPEIVAFCRDIYEYWCRRAIPIRCDGWPDTTTFDQLKTRFCTPPSTGPSTILSRSGLSDAPTDRASD